MKKKIISMVLGLMVLGSISASAAEKVPTDFNGWNYKVSTQSWEYYIKGEKLKNGEIQDKDKLYYFDENGDLLNGTYTFNGTTVTFKYGIAIY